MSNKDVIRVRDLDANTTPAFLYCDACQGRYSANRADYFLRSPAAILDCCGQPMYRVIERMRLERA